MSDKVFVDTNILLYARDADQSDKQPEPLPGYSAMRRAPLVRQSRREPYAHRQEGRAPSHPDPLYQLTTLAPDIVAPISMRLCRRI